MRRPPPPVEHVAPVVIAVHVHRIVVAQKRIAAASTNLAPAIDEAVAAGMPRRILLRAVTRADDRERTLDRAADRLLAAAGFVEVSALLAEGDAGRLTATDDEDAE